MKIWYDACTGKHVRYGVAIAKRLREKGHKIVLTTRKHPDTIPLANLLGEKFIVVGKYNPKSLSSRLRESLRRQLIFCRMFEKETPDVAVSHCSVELCRVAFGLGIPNISTHDTVHADAVNRLTMPLIDFLVVSKALPMSSIRGYGIKKIYWFDGVDEVAWIKGFQPQITYPYDKPLIVVRQLEEKAAYATNKSDWTKALARKLTSLGTVVFLPRYHRRSQKGFIDSASLVAHADLVVCAGGTIAREAALQGVPTIVVKSFEKIYVNDYLAARGFPIFTVNLTEVLSYAKKLMGKRWDVKSLLDQLENPVDVIESIIEKEICKQW
jgi:predicted glycosyltransferase